jgi:sugar (pentulose or hexulose) kinase
MIFCGIDIGTTNTKAVLIDSEGALIDRVSLDDELSKTTNWYEHFCFIFDYFASRGHFTHRKVVCSITTQGGSFILLDEKFNPVSRAYSWTETADDGIAEDMASTFGAERYYRMTGWEPLSWLMTCKLKNLVSRKQMPENMRYIATVSGFIHSKVAGEFITDITNAQITGLCDFQKSCWDEKILNWAGIDKSFLPKIADKLSILFEDVRTKWGKISFATSSHDQYAAMQAAGLVRDKQVMLGSGTAWVINVRTSSPVFDNCHPGRDIFEGGFGGIITTGKPIGRGLDELLAGFNLTPKQLDGMEKNFNRNDFPTEAVSADNIKETEPAKATQRYMETTGSLIAFLLENFNEKHSFILPAKAGIRFEKGNTVIMSGQAAMSTFWPQVIADLCGLAVEAVNFPEFTAYGAALHAKSAFEGKWCDSNLLNIAGAKRYEPLCSDQYQQWHKRYQKPMYEKKLTKNCNIRC